MPMSASPRSSTRPASPPAPPAPYWAFACICSVMPRSAKTLARCTPLWPPPTGLEHAIDFAASMARLKPSAVERSGFGAPFGTATPIDDRAISTALPSTSLPCSTRSRTPLADTIATSATSPSPICFSSRSDGPSVTSSRLPVARSKAGDNSSNTIFIAVVLSTLMSIATGKPSGVAALRDHIDQRRGAGAHRFKTAFDRGEQVAWLFDLQADAAAGGDHLLVVRRRLELRERHRVRLGGVAVGKHVERRRT